MSDMTSAVAIDLLDNLIGMVEDNQKNDYDTALRMAIDALKTQADGDTISRKAAIDTLYHVDEYNGRSVEAIRNLPSTQPEKRTDKCTKTHSCDCISRQAAIDIVQGYAEQLQGYIGMPNDSEVYAYARGLLLSIDRNIKALPSAQPEKRTEERTETHGVCLDAIDRQAAVDTVRKIILGFFSDEDGAMTDTEKTLLSVNKAICNELTQLPSAQPEVLACGEGELIAQPVGTPLHEVIDIYTGYVGVDDDYPVSVKQVLNITAELGALETQSRVRELPRYQVTADEDFEKQIHAMFDHIWDCEIEHPVFQDRVGDLMNAVIKCHADMRGGAV